RPAGAGCSLRGRDRMTETAAIHSLPRGQHHAPLSLVAGGAGFIGSHICRALLDRGHEVLCIDNLQTARASNLAPLQAHARFGFLHCDIAEPLPAALLAETGRIAQVWNLACAA